MAFFLAALGQAVLLHEPHAGRDRSGAKRDFMQVARCIVEQAIGEQMDGSPLPPPPKDNRNPHAVALGIMGGKARAKKLSTGGDPSTFQRAHAKGGVR